MERNKSGNIDKSTRKKITNLVDNLDRIEPRARALFELCAGCVVPSGAEENYRAETADKRLFAPLGEPPVPMKGRQTYRMWKAMVELGSSPFRKSRLTEKIKLLRFLPLENYNIGNVEIEGLKSCFSAFLVAFLEAFFPGLEIVLEDQFDIKQMNPVSRFHKLTGKKQYLVTDLYTRLHRATGFNKKDYILGLTWTDLYPSEEMNFALGEALFSHRCAVFSFGRFEPLLYRTDQNKEPATADSNISKADNSFTAPTSGQNCGKVHSECTTDLTLNSDQMVEVERNELRDEIEESSKENKDDGSDVLQITGDLVWKMIRVSSHELCHLFGLSHCVFFLCAMNESKSVKEALEQPLYLCPVCLRKLQKFFSFDIPARYRQMLDICMKVQRSYPSAQLGETIGWLKRVLNFLSIQ